MDRPTYTTQSQVQSGPHYATHVDQPIQRIPLKHIGEAAMDHCLHVADPATCRGIPECVNYKDGVIRVWPWPAEGWQVWSEVSAKDVTP